MIDRNPAAASTAAYDLIVVGGGIYGSMVALEAARRGLEPLLLERDDFGGHTSGSWLGILHGGLRYLQSLDLRRHRASTSERRWFLSTFPDLVEPLRVVMPLYGDGLRRASVMGAALRLNDALSWYRNRGVRPDRSLPRGRLASAEETLRLLPSADPRGLRSGAIWYDGVTHHPQRLLMETLRWAAGLGATALNYVEAVELLQDGGRVRGVVGRDAVSGRVLEFGAPVIVNCAGPWWREVADRFHGATLEPRPPSIAFNLLFDRASDFEGAAAVTARRSGARTYFLRSWRGRVLAGTYHAPLTGASPDDGPSPSAIQAFASELDEAIPALGLASSRVLRVYGGQLPVRRPGTVDLSTRDLVHDHERAGGPRGLFSVSGTKFTTARRAAERVLGAARGRGLLGAWAEPVWAPPTVRAPTAAGVIALMAVEEPERARRAIGSIVAEEAVVRPEDLLLRRTVWGVAGPPPATRLKLVHEAVPEPPRQRTP